MGGGMQVQREKNIRHSFAIQAEWKKQVQTLFFPGAQHLPQNLKGHYLRLCTKKKSGRSVHTMLQIPVALGRNRDVVFSQSLQPVTDLQRSTKEMSAASSTCCALSGFAQRH
mmetsp:Transcript_38329/g.63363  ORF Transcript_38329/g.63363 Transcript_38329/m.63363 type:complete len:112 (+) Transcript_38329:781-1116(+)